MSSSGSIGTPVHTLHPRRLFCTEQVEVDATSCVRPSVVAQQERLGHASSPFYVQPLLAPSPVAGSSLSSDVDILVDFVHAIDAKNFPQLFDCPQVKLRQLEPLRDALVALHRRLVEGGTKTELKRVDTTFMVGDEKSVLSSSNVTAELEHLRIIQKELKGLFAEDAAGNVDAGLRKNMRPIRTLSSRASSLAVSLSPIRDSSGPEPIMHQEDPSVIINQSDNQATDESMKSSSRFFGQTASRISKAMCDSSVVASSVFENNEDIRQLTLSPMTELFDRDSIQQNPWFQGSMKKALKTDDHAPLPATINNKISSREITAPANASKTVEALQNAIGARKQGQEKNNIPNNILGWIQRQTTVGTTAGSAKGLATLYSSRNKTNFHETSQATTYALYRN